MTPVRVYADTSVYGGVFDAEFAPYSAMFFDQVLAGRFDLVVSPVVRRELDGAPARVIEFFERSSAGASFADVTADARGLQRAYLETGILTAKSSEDALHVALATTANCAVLLSWNFKHIVHRDKALRYNAINALHGFPALDIRAPREVVIYEEGL